MTSVRNMMGVVDRMYQFFAAHPKRQGALEEAISSTQLESTALNPLTGEFMSGKK